MLTHHIQRTIVKQLSSKDSQRFSELKPDDIENKAFDYHLKQLLTDKIVQKSESGGYELTALGRKLGVSATPSLKDRSERAFSVLFLVIKSGRRWLLYKRKTHPLKDKVGFMHVRPIAHESILVTAQKVCLEKTGLTCDFKYRANGYFRMFKAQEVESFTHFTLLVCEQATGELLVSDEFAEYAWATDPDFSSEDMLPNMDDIVGLLADSKQTFLEKSYDI